jgi:hypothetical protein
MPELRLLLAHSILAVVVLGSAFDIITAREHWRFSPYPMFNRISGSSLSKVILFGVSGGDQAVEIPVQTLPYRTHIVSETPLVASLARIVRNTNGPRLLQELLREYLLRHDAGRATELLIYLLLAGVALLWLSREVARSVAAWAKSAALLLKAGRSLPATNDLPR